MHPRCHINRLQERFHCDRLYVIIYNCRIRITKHVAFSPVINAPCHHITPYSVLAKPLPLPEGRNSKSEYYRSSSIHK